jgi:hypothetical protein
MNALRETESIGKNVWQAADGWHIDVRGLKPPSPMLDIISLIEMPELGSRLVVHHDREPVFLYPELAERGWTWRLIEGEPGEVRLVLERETSRPC